MAAMPTSCIYVHKLGPRKILHEQTSNCHQPSLPLSPLELLMRTLNYTPRQAVVMSSLLHTWDKHSWENLSHQVSGLQSVLPTPFLYGMNAFNLIKTLQWLRHG